MCLINLIISQTNIMPSDIILSDVPTKYGNKSLIMRAIQPENVTWDDIFNFIENKTTMPRKFIVGSRADGGYVYGKYNNYPPFNYIKHAFINQDGVITNTALVNIHTNNFVSN